MLFLNFLTLVSVIVEVLFLSISIAAGLYYLAEMAEEYCHFVRKIVHWTIVVSVVALSGMWLFEDLPFTVFVPNLVSQLIYYKMMQKFPTIKVVSASFASAIVLLVYHHFSCLRHFVASNFNILQIFGFFVICVWPVPFLLFISLSTDDYVLPLVTDRSQLSSQSQFMSSQTSADAEDLSSSSSMFDLNNPKFRKKYKLLTLYNYVKESFPFFGNKKFY